MSASLDIQRLDNIARQIGGQCSKEFTQAVDKAASELLTLGILKLVLLSSDDKSNLPVAILLDWLGSRYASVMAATRAIPRRQEAAAVSGQSIKKMALDPKDKDRLKAAVKDLLALTNQDDWRSIDQEACLYLGQMKIYAKAVKEEDKK